MGRDWESVFNTWSRGPGQTESEKCANAERVIKTAIDNSSVLQNRGVKVFAQGSYKNRTNVRADSDVDICVLCETVLFPHYHDGITQEELGLTDSDYTFTQFKDEVESALRTHFTTGSITRGNKAFDVHANTYRVDADVVPAFVMREYYRYNGQIAQREGVEIRPDKGGRIQNYPQQHFDNGVEKNRNTNRHYKRVVRIFKCLRNEMAETSGSIANSIPSFLLESLVWNVPDDHFKTDGYREDVRRAIIYLFNNTKDDENCKKWCEVNNIKFLFHSSQKWNRQAANDFLAAAWSYAEYRS